MNLFHENFSSKKIFLLSLLYILQLKENYPRFFSQARKKQGGEIILLQNKQTQIP